MKSVRYVEAVGIGGQLVIIAGKKDVAVTMVKWFVRFGVGH